MQQFYHLKEGILWDLSSSIGGSNAKLLIFCKEELARKAKADQVLFGKETRIKCYVRREAIQKRV